jgi:4-amino-4-deoxy-L-arabinose transferase-like glycosyltransferase
VIARLTAIRQVLLAHRTAIARLLALLAVVCMALSAYAFRPQSRSLVHYRPTRGPQDYFDPRAPWLFGGGALLMIAGLALARIPLAQPSRDSHSATDQEPTRLSALWPRWAWWLAGPGVLLLWLMAEANGEVVSWFDRLWPLAPSAQFALLVAGIALVVIGLGGVPQGVYHRRHREHRDSTDDAGGAIRESPLQTRVPEPAHNPIGDFKPSLREGSNQKLFRREIGLVVLLTLAALVVRFWNLGEDVTVMVDEGHFALGVTYFRYFPDVNLLEPMPTSASFPFIYSYGQAGMVELFGRNFQGLRAFSALLGALTIPATYGLARELFTRRIALMAAVLLLALPPHIHYSRLALNNIADPLCGVLALMFVARAQRTRHRLDYVLSGVALGFTQYFYEGGRILYPALIVGWMGAGFVLWKRKPSPRGLILLALAFLIVAMPVYYTLYGQDFPFFNRMDKTELRAYYWERDREDNNFMARVARFRHSVMLYINSPENTLFHYYLYYGGHHPLLLVYVVPVFMLGVVIAVWYWRQPGAILLLGWMLGTSAGNALLVESAVTARYVVAFPAVALLLALGIDVTLRVILPGSSKDQGHFTTENTESAEEIMASRKASASGVTHQYLMGGAAILIALALAAGQIAFYFGPFIDLFNVEVRAHVSFDAEDAILRSVDMPPGTEVWIIGEDVLPQLDAQRLMNFLVDDRVVVVATPPDIAVSQIATLPYDRDYAFFVAPTDIHSLGVLRTVFGDRTIQRTTNEDIPRKQAFWLFYVTAESRVVG